MTVRWPTGFMNAVVRPARSKPSNRPRDAVVLPQFFVADAAVYLGLVTDIMERLGPYLESDAVDADTMSRLRDGIALVERKTSART